MKAIVNVRRFLRQGISEKLPARFAFAAWIVADKIVCTGAAAVKGYQVETRPQA